jgi:putative alpha-1,2-mannosidase
MVEGSASQYRWVVPFNHQGLIEKLGGNATVNPLLDSFFTNLNDGSGKGALMTNEFELGAQYWYNYTGEPWKTQDVVNRMRTQLYQLQPGYVPNNDDLGALSSQEVWSMLGMFPVYPGSGILVLNGPEFPHETIQLPSGNVLTINGVGASTSAPYIQSLQVNGQASTTLYLEPSVLTSGATLDFTMGSTANMSWGTGASDAPPSY